MNDWMIYFEKFQSYGMNIEVMLVNEELRRTFVLDLDLFVSLDGLNAAIVAGGAR